MEHIHGIDVSWMSHGTKDKGARQIPRRRNTIHTHPSSPPLSESPPPSSQSSPPLSTSLDNPSPLLVQPPAPGTKLQRRSSWFSSLSSKFSSAPGSSPQASNATPKQAELSVPRANPSKNAVLQHAAKSEGEEPYIPAPPKSSSQTGFFQVLRRLSTTGSSNPNLRANHGLVERRILNVDQNRERCQMTELQQTKLRRVAFCVDVEIAPMPKYEEQDSAPKKPVCVATRKSAEKSEGDALKIAKATPPAAKPQETPPKATNGAASPAAPAPAPAPSAAPSPSANKAAPIVVPSVDPAPVAKPAASPTKPKETPAAAQPASAATDGKTTGDGTRKKEKKKKSEEERKARKERKRRLAEANGSIPMEIHLDSDDSDHIDAPAGNGNAVTIPRMQLTPTTNPVRIYRRCCQLRETPILKKIVEQLSDPTAFSSEVGVVTKLDLTGYWIQLADLVTLGDFLAVVPIREVILDNCGLNDDGLRVILAGLLAARKPQKKHIHLCHHQLHNHSHSGSSASHGQTVPVTASKPNGATQQGGFVERLVLKNNKIGTAGWKYVCLFVYMCRSLKVLDLSKITVPQPRASQSLQAEAEAIAPSPGTPRHKVAERTVGVAELLSKAIGERLGGATLELLNFGDTAIAADSIGMLIDGIIKCGTKRLGLANNDLDDAGVAHVARYIASGKCESLDLGGNDLRDRLENLADAVGSTDSLWALSLADCNLKPNSLCKLLPQLTKLHNFRFLDLSHNHDLFEMQPSAIALLRRYLPQMVTLKRLNLADVAMNAEQAIAFAEIIPEINGLTHLDIMHNAALAKLADARTEEVQEQACAFYASMLAATRLSPSIVAIDMEPLTAESTEIVRGMAKQVLAYCLRNVDRVTSRNTDAIGSDALACPDQTETSSTESSSKDSSETPSLKNVEYPDVIQHLVGHDVEVLDEGDDVDVAPDDDYVIGGTGVAQALECCLKNRGTDSGRPSGEFEGEVEGDSTGASTTSTKLGGPSKAKDMSKHLLLSARKIRLRLQAPLQKAKTMTGGTNITYERLLFLDKTLDGIIKRFEDEFPETRVSMDSGVSLSQPPSVASAKPHSDSMDSANEAEPDLAAVLSDGEDDTEIGHLSGLSRSNSAMSLSSKGLTNEEGRVLRAGHRFRSGWFKHYNLLSGVEEIESDPAHKRLLYELVTELNNPELNQKVAEKGIARVFSEDRSQILEILKTEDPEHWERFMESQEKARANLRIDLEDSHHASFKLGGVDEEAIDDDTV